MAKKYKLIFEVPATQAAGIRQALGELGAGQIGDYDHASFSIKGTGRFRPLQGANPTIGRVGQIEEVEEEQVQMLVSEEKLALVLEKLSEIHPYEEPGIAVYELANFQ